MTSKKKTDIPASEKDLKDRTKFRDMTKWFDPKVLIQTGIQAFITSVFAQHADGRPLQALHDNAPEDIKKNGYDLRNSLAVDGDGAIWFDYVADLGDGFDSTYAVAYMLAQKKLQVEGVPHSLPRGKLLIMGGDEVYPYASRDDYRYRLRDPYRFAFPDSQSEEAEHPKLFLIPGNHDWYDGLKEFGRQFCTGRPVKVGSWVTGQHRSYFSLRLTDNWWLWGFDSGVDNRDIDVPQEAYFKAIAATMSDSANLIICASVPTWTDVGDEEKLYEMQKGVNRLANIAKNAKHHIQIHAAISGDRHSYNRYKAKNSPTQFITAGGGGAFLHPTHDLAEPLPMPWMGKHLELSLRTSTDSEYTEISKAACYPSQEDSRNLVLANWKFPWVNKQFCLVVGGLYWLVGLLLQNTRDLSLFDCIFTNPLFVLSTIGLGLALWQYADATRGKIYRACLTVGHTITHSMLITLVSVLLPTASNGFWEFWGFLAGTLILGGILGGFIWGIYLLIACYGYRLHHNDAFSALASPKYRNFLRLKIKGDELTVYPIGLDDPPKRKDWMINNKAVQNNQDESVIVPRNPLTPKLIEGPIVISRAK